MKGSSKLRRASKPKHPPQLPIRPYFSGRNVVKGDVTAATAPLPSREDDEKFILFSSGLPLSFSMIIKLTPVILEEIKHLEAQGDRARVKFDSNGCNPAENIIDVGGKQFRFTWSQEFGDLCDIYEERQSGEDGNGLLVESGCAWRKLNVHRTLDESTKNHVKMRSEEAERKLKSRKAIVLEPGNPSMKALAAAEATLLKNCNKKKEAAPPKKSRVETLQVGGPKKSTYRPGLSTTTATMSTGRHSSSSLSFPPDQSAASLSPLGAINISKGIDDVVQSQKIGKQNGVPDKEIFTRTNNVGRNTQESKGKNIVEPIDLQNMLISLLMNKPDGMTSKALEKAIKGIVPNPKKKIKPIVRKIASYKSPGRYILLPGVDLESFKKPSTECGSSPDDNYPQLSAHQEIHDEMPTPQGGLKENVSDDGLEELLQLNSKVEQLSKILENSNDQRALPDIFGEKKGSGLSEGQEGNSSDRGSGSDSESGGGSHSGRRSRSTAGRRSGSGCDSENGASANSKEVLYEDEDVDIVTSYAEKDFKNKTEASAKRVFSLIPGNSLDGRSLKYKTHEKQDNNESDAVEAGKNMPAEPDAEMALATVTISKDSSWQEEFDSHERLYEGKHERSSAKNIFERAKLIKRSKAEYSGQAQGSLGTGVQMFETTRSFSPSRARGKVSRNPGDGSNGNKRSLSMDSHCLKQGEVVGRLKEGQPGTHYVLRESNPDEFLVTMLLEQKNSSDASLESRKPSPTFESSGFPSNLESTNKKITDILFEESTRCHATTLQPHAQRWKAINVDIESQNKLAEMSGGLRSNESGASQGLDLEGRSDNSNAPANASSPNSLEVVANRARSSGFVDKNNNSDDNWRKYFSDENPSYLKYEKVEAELKGPIMSFSQYQEYVHEFREKYDTYLYLNKACASYRDVFQELVNGLNDAEGDNDRYSSVLGKLMESYETYGMKHKRQKKIYVVLQRELESIKQRITEFVEAQNRE